MDTPVNENIQNYSINNKKKKKSGCLIAFIIFVLLIVIAVSIPFVINKIKANKQAKREALMELTSAEKIYEDFAKGNITADEYIMQLAYDEYDKSKMNSKYASKNNMKLSNNVFEKAEKYKDSLSKETLKYLYEKISLSNLEFTTDVSEGDTGFDSFGAVYAGTHDDSLRTKINKVKLSPNGRFLIWYSNIGDSKVDEKMVEKYAQEIEDMVNKIEEIYGIEYKYEPEICMPNYERNPTKEKMKKVLKWYDIEEDYLDKAFNIYICYTDNTKEDGLYGVYVPNFEWYEQAFLTIFDGVDGNTIGEAAAVPYFPYFAVSPRALSNYEEFKLVCAHEFFHHFQKYYCGDGTYKDAVAGDFTVETTANWASASLYDSKDENNIMTGWATEYVLECDKPINEIEGNGHYGYAGLCFARVYEEKINEGKQKLLESMKKENPMEYLVNAADNRFPYVMMELAKRNVTNEYDHNTFKSTELPPNSLDISSELMHKEETIKEYSMKYYYLDKSNFKNNTIVNVVPRASGELNYVLLGKKGNSYNQISNGFLQDDGIEIETETYFQNYSQIIIGVVNATDRMSVYDVLSSNAALKKGIEGKIESNSAERKEVLKNVEEVEFKVSDMTSVLKEFSDLGKELGEKGKNEISDQEIKESIDETISELQEFDKNLDELDNKSKLKTVKLKSIEIPQNADKEEMHEIIKNLYAGIKIKVIDIRLEEGARVSAGFVLKPFELNKICLYAVCTSNTEGSFAYLVEIENK